MLITQYCLAQVHYNARPTHQIVFESRSPRSPVRMLANQHYLAVQRTLSSTFGSASSSTPTFSLWTTRMASSVTPNAEGTSDPETTVPDASSNPVVAKVLDNFIKQYETRDTKFQDSIIDEAYTANAVFDDNLFHVTSPKNIKPQFHAVAKMFKSVKVETKSSTLEGPDAEGNSVLKVYNVQEYILGSKEVIIECDTTFKLDKEGKITSHYDVWRDRPANFGILKRVGGSFGSWVMRLVKY